MPTLKVWPAAASLAAAEDATLEAAALEAVLLADEPQPVRPSAETTAAAEAAFRKLRREILFMVFIAVLLSPERAAQMINKKPAPLAERGKRKRPRPCVLSTRTGSVKFDSAVPPCLPCSFPRLKTARAPQRRANTPLPCNGGFRPKLLRHFCLFARPSAAHESLPRSRPFSLSGLTADALCRFSSASLV